LRDAGYRITSLDGTAISERLESWPGDEIVAEP
jgi:hypothetical protein